MNQQFLEKEYVTDFKPGYGSNRAVWAKSSGSRYVYVVHLLEGKWKTYPKTSSEPIYAVTALDAARGAWAIDGGKR